MKAGMFIHHLAAWHWFATFTFCCDVSPVVAWKRFRIWRHKMNRDIYGKWYFKHHSGVGWWAVLAPQGSGRLHLHALVTEVQTADRKYWRLLWEQMKLCGNANIRSFDSNRGAAWYLAQHMRVGSDFDFGGRIR